MDWREIAKQAEEIDKQIEALEAKREEVLCQDGPYREYLKRYKMCHPRRRKLTIEALHEFTKRLNELGEQAPSFKDANYERWWQAHEREIQDLEYWICA